MKTVLFTVIALAGLHANANDLTIKEKIITAEYQKKIDGFKTEIKEKCGCKGVPDVKVAWADLKTTLSAGYEEKAMSQGKTCFEQYKMAAVNLCTENAEYKTGVCKISEVNIKKGDGNVDVTATKATLTATGSGCKGNSWIKEKMEKAL